jgi:protein O-mannosyl-transferase
MNSTFASPPDSERRSTAGAAIVVLIASTLLTMGRLCAHDFLWYDDQNTVHQNHWLQPPTTQTLIHYWSTPAYGLYIPITYTVWVAVAAFAHVPKDQFGIAMNPWLFHGVNVSFHLLAVLVAYRILMALKVGTFAACCGALLFGVHPIQVEAVGWVSGLKDVLSGLLSLIALWLYISWASFSATGRASTIRYALAALAFILAMFAKPSAMALPLAALGIDRWAIGRHWRKVLPGAIGWTVIALPIADVARGVQLASYVPMPPIWLRPLIASDALAFYLEKLFWPVNFAIDYGRSPSAVLHHGWCYWTWIFPAIALALLISGARRRPILLAATVIFLAGCLPVLGFSPAQFEIYSTTADHYLYLSMFGPALALACLLSTGTSLLLRTAVVAALISLIGLSIRQGSYWQNDFTLFAHDVEVNPGSFMGYIDLGISYERTQDPRSAVSAFENAVRVGPDWPLAWHELAAALAAEGDTDRAIRVARRAIELQLKYPALKTTWFEDNRMLGQLLFEEGRFADAMPYLGVASSLHPGDAKLANDWRSAKKIAATQSTAAATQPSPAVVP